MTVLFNRKHSIHGHSGSLYSRSNFHQVTHQSSTPNQSSTADSYDDLVSFVDSLGYIFRAKFDHRRCHNIAVLTFTKVYEFYQELMLAAKSCDMDLNANANLHRSRAISRIKCIVSF